MRTSLPVDFEFFGDHHRQRGLDALADFRLLRDQRHAAVAADADEGVGDEVFRFGSAAPASPIAPPACRPIRRRAPDWRRKLRRPGRLLAHFFPFALAAISAARWMPARMRM
jgi:hypothetical protein